LDVLGLYLSGKDSASNPSGMTQVYMLSRNFLVDLPMDDLFCSR